MKESTRHEIITIGIAIITCLFTPDRVSMDANVITAVIIDRSTATATSFVPFIQASSLSIPESMYVCMLSLTTIELSPNIPSTMISAVSDIK